MSETPNSLIVGTSLAAESDPVVQAALTIGKVAGLDVVLAHGFPVPIVYGGGVYATGTIDSQIDAETQRCRLAIERQLERLGTTPDEVADIVIEMDSGHRVITDLADRLDASLIVVGAHEAHGPLSGFLGSTADRLLRRTTKPVLVVRGAFGLPHKVLAPVDLSPISEAALARGLECVDQWTDQATIEALFVLSRLDREGSVHFQPAQVDGFAMEALEDFLGRLPERDRPIVSVLRNGHPRQEILDYQADHNADLVLLGTHGRSGFERFLLGSVASEVLRQLDTHALVIPPDPDADTDATAVDSEPKS